MKTLQENATRRSRYWYPHCRLIPPLFFDFFYAIRCEMPFLQSCEKKASNSFWRHFTKKIKPKLVSQCTDVFKIMQASYQYSDTYCHSVARIYNFTNQIIVLRQGQKKPTCLPYVIHGIVKYSLDFTSFDGASTLPSEKI